jgi:hypothetical protein
MTMLLVWRQPAPPVILRWRGPQSGIASVAAAMAPIAVPTLIGPPGIPGPQGPIAEIIDCGTFN